MRLTFVDKQTADIDGRHYERSTYMIGNYTVYVDDTTLTDGYSFHEITVNRPFGDFRGTDENRFLPQITYQNGIFDDTNGPRKKPRFTIQTTSYGALEAEQFMKFLEAQRTALEVVETLTREFIAGLPTVKLDSQEEVRE